MSGRHIAFALLVCAYLAGCAPPPPMPEAMPTAADAAVLAADRPAPEPKSSGPIALTFGLIPPAPSAAQPLPPPAAPAAKPANAPPAALSAVVPAMAPAVASQAAPINCPPDTIGMWSQPDLTGSDVYICRALHPPR